MVKVELCTLDGDGPHEGIDCGLTDGKPESCPYSSF